MYSIQYIECCERYSTLVQYIESCAVLVNYNAQFDHVPLNYKKNCFALEVFIGGRFSTPEIFTVFFITASASTLEWSPI